jgi:riboflavin biosynthesis pyrimidine reductase
MEDKILQLYPQPPQECKLQGLYLAHDLRQQRNTGAATFIYANFITSLDGRIAVPRPSGGGLKVPETTANERDWRLFQELAAQADVIISSGRYLREWAAGRAQEILQVDDPRFADLRAWRQQHNLRPQPDIAILSASLDFPIPDVLTAGGRQFLVFTPADPHPARVAEIEAHGGRVFVAGQQAVLGDRLAHILAQLGYRFVYSAAGPQILHLLAAGGVLDRLYLTFASRLLAGEPFASIAEGPLFDPPVDARLFSLYFDPLALDGLGQLFACYQVRPLAG